MDRREFLTGAVALATAAATATPAARAAAAEAVPRDPKLTKAVETAHACLAAGDACIRHCVDLLGKGDTSLEACMRTVLDMSAACDGLAKLASYASAPNANLRAYAAACAAYCRDCSKACQEHAKHHEPCKACMESCDACVKACEALAA